MLPNRIPIYWLPDELVYKQAIQSNILLVYNGLQELRKFAQEYIQLS